MSGDVHFGEITRYDCGPMGYPLYDVTSSGLTQAVEEVGNSVVAFMLRFAAWLMPNTMRVYSKKCRHRSCVYGKTFHVPSILLTSPTFAKFMFSRPINISGRCNDDYMI